jgi:hypothetical protein
LLGIPYVGGWCTDRSTNDAADRTRGRAVAAHRGAQRARAEGNAIGGRKDGAKDRGPRAMLSAAGRTARRTSGAVLASGAARRPRLRGAVQLVRSAERRSRSETGRRGSYAKKKHRKLLKKTRICDSDHTNSPHSDREDICAAHPRGGGPTPRTRLGKVRQD